MNTECEPDFIFDPAEWGPLPSPLDKQKSQLDLLRWAADILLPKYPNLRIPKWCRRLPGHEKGDIDLPIERRIDGKRYLVVHGELLNWWQSSVGDASRPRNYKHSINMAAKSGDVLVHPRYHSVLILCGGNPKKLYLHHKELGWKLIRFPEPIYPIHTEEQKQWALKTMKKLFDMAMSVTGRSLCKNIREGNSRMVVDDDTGNVFYTQTTLDRFSGS